MHSSNVIYRRLTARMALLGISKSEVARQMQISYSTLQHKLCGETAFTLAEAVRLHRLLSMPEPLEVAFERYDEHGAQH